MTRLKETVDMYRGEFQIKYLESKMQVTGSEHEINKINIILEKIGNQPIVVGHATNSNKSMAKQQASQNAIDILRRQYKIYKEPPAIYSFFCS